MSCSIHMTAPTCILISLMATESYLLASTEPHTPPVRQFLCTNPKPGTSPSPGQRTDWVEPGVASGHWILHTVSSSAGQKPWSLATVRAAQAKKASLYVMHNYSWLLTYLTLLCWIFQWLTTASWVIAKCFWTLILQGWNQEMWHPSIWHQGL